MAGFPTLLKASLLAAGLIVTGVATASVEIVGLFKDRAVIRTTRGEELIRVGQTSANGVKLLFADAEKARVQYQGKTFDLSLSNRVGSSFQEAAVRSVSVNMDQSGSFRVNGSINGNPANFLVDTGANVVALSSKAAGALGINYQIGEISKVVTAQGEVDAKNITLTEVSVGGVKAHNVSATVIEGNYPVEILLGMSFLSQVSMKNEGGVLTLSQRR
jgi:aspartyl protease family protein